MKNTVELLGLLTLLDPRSPDGERVRAGPTELEKPCEPDEVGQRRSLWCPAYDRCLDAALRRRWRSWSCESCPLFPLAGPFRTREAENACAGRPFERSASGPFANPGF
jgi:hypothetical protein